MKEEHTFLLHRQAHSSFSPLTMHIPQPINSEPTHHVSISLCVRCLHWCEQKLLQCSSSECSVPPLLPSFIQSRPLCLRHQCSHLSFLCAVYVSGRGHCVWGCCLGPCVSRDQRSSQICVGPGHSTRCEAVWSSLSPSRCVCHSPCDERGALGRS